MVKALAFAGVLALVGILGCGGLIGCGGLEGWVKDLSEENPYYTGGSPVHKVYEGREVSRTETRVDCEGRAKLKDGRSLYISYHSYIDSDGETRIGFNVLR